MMKKLEKLLDLLIEGVELGLIEERKKHELSFPTPAVPAAGALGPRDVEIHAGNPAPAPAAAKRTRKARMVEADVQAANEMFPPETPAAPAAAPKSNAQVIADTAAKCQELVGTFIRRLNHHTPNTGLKAAQQIVTEIAPACVGKKIEEWAHGDRLKIIARMEQELGQVEAQV